MGGSIYNRGDIVVDGDAEFIGSKGGVRTHTQIYQYKVRLRRVARLPSSRAYRSFGDPNPDV